MLVFLLTFQTSPFGSPLEVWITEKNNRRQSSAELFSLTSTVSFSTALPLCPSRSSLISPPQGSFLDPFFLPFFFPARLGCSFISLYGPPPIPYSTTVCAPFFFVDSSVFPSPTPHRWLSPKRLNGVQPRRPRSLPLDPAFLMIPFC